MDICIIYTDGREGAGTAAVKAAQEYSIPLAGFCCEDSVQGDNNFLCPVKTLKEADRLNFRECKLCIDFSFKETGTTTDPRMLYINLTEGISPSVDTIITTLDSVLSKAGSVYIRGEPHLCSPSVHDSVYKVLKKVINQKKSAKLFI